MEKEKKKKRGNALHLLSCEKLEWDPIQLGKLLVGVLP